MTNTIAVRQQIPEVIVSQLQKTHPADDNGIWYFRLPETSNDVQIESSSGMSPFLVETDEQSSHQARMAQTVAETVQMIVAYLLPLRRTADERRI
ncbi:MAG TPA: hypothetical protein VKE41_05470 [Roseiflexaceae bacterium]|nr:hypothetical protein [Roseiflexaceae bacterium]